MTKKKTLVILAVVLIVALAALFLYYRNGKPSPYDQVNLPEDAVVTTDGNALAVQNNSDTTSVVLGSYAFLERSMENKWYCVKNIKVPLHNQAGGGVIQWDGQEQVFELNLLPLESGNYRVVIPDSYWGVGGMSNSFGRVFGVEFVVD